MKFLQVLPFFVILSIVTNAQLTTPHITGDIPLIETGTALVLHAISRDTLGRAPITGHRFVMPLEHLLLDSTLAIPAMLQCRDLDARRSASAPLAIEPAAITVRISPNGYPAYGGSPLQENFADFVVEIATLDAQLTDRSTAAVNDSIQNLLGGRMDTFYSEHRKTPLKAFASVIFSDFLNRRFIDPADLTDTRMLCAPGMDADSNDLRICRAIASYYEQWIGTPVREFDGVLAGDIPFHIRDIIGVKPVLIDFWASWCGPCIREMPELKAIYDAGNIDIVGISIDTREDAWLKSLEKLQLPWHNLRDAQHLIAPLYQVTSVPTKFLINRDGIIVARNPEDLRKAIHDLD